MSKDVGNNNRSREGAGSSLGSFISDNRKELAVTHYIRKATTANYWFDFSSNTLRALSARGTNFCLVINGSDETDDAYILPFLSVKELFTESTTDDRGRWVGTITKDVLKIHSANIAMNISRFYNQFDFLDTYNELNSEPTFRGVGTETLSFKDIEGSIIKFNQEYQSATPEKRATISERIARPGAIAELVKQYRNYKCQICKAEGFLQKNGKQYAETHHFLELHKLLPGSLCSDNLLVLCPTCHRKIHYSKITIENLNELQFNLRFNNEQWQTIERNVLTSTKIQISNF